MTKPAMKPDQVISTLNSLIELNRDGQKGFQEASDKIGATDQGVLFQTEPDPRQIRRRAATQVRSWAAKRKKPAALPRPYIAAGLISRQPWAAATTRS